MGHWALGIGQNSDLFNNLIAGKREHNLGTPQKWVNAVPVTLLELVYPSAW
ncbi:MAG: hypothetical protein V7L11_12200 [Nostoc sp.]|uniref:hypothetical protein n=1 Tax=Nostoc sp. TaxID=1180 RepID=UPI002FF75621